jgi:hypothetical protein
MSVDQHFDRDTASIINEYVFCFDMHEQMADVHRDILSFQELFDEDYKIYKRYEELYDRNSFEYKERRMTNCAMETFELKEKIPLRSFLYYGRLRSKDVWYRKDTSLRSNLLREIHYSLDRFDYHLDRWKQSKHQLKNKENISGEAFLLVPWGGKPFTFRGNSRLLYPDGEYEESLPKLWDDYRISMFSD